MMEKDDFNLDRLIGEELGSASSSDSKSEVRAKSCEVGCSPSKKLCQISLLGDIECPLEVISEQDEVESVQKDQIAKQLDEECITLSDRDDQDEKCFYDLTDVDSEFQKGTLKKQVIDGKETVIVESLVHVRIQDVSKSRFYWINRVRAEPMKAVLDAHALTLDVPFSKLRFMFDGNPVSPEQCVNDLEIEDEEVIDCVVIEKEIDREFFTYSSVYTPAFVRDPILSAIEKLEENCEVFFSVGEKLMGISEFGKKVKELSAINPPAIVKTFSSFLLASPLSPVDKAFSWMWKSEDGKYSPYSPEICTVLTSSFISSPKDCVTIDIGPKKFCVDFQNMVQYNDTERCDIYTLNASPKWYYYRDDLGTTSAFTATESLSIENAFSKGNSVATISVSDALWDFNFDFLQATEAANSSHVLTIERVMEPNAEVSCESDLLFHVCGVASNIETAIVSLKLLLQDSTRMLTHDLPTESSTVDQTETSLLTSVKQYCIRASVSGDSSGKHSTLILEGVEGYVDVVMDVMKQASLPLSKQAIVPSCSSASLDDNCPKYWEPQSSVIELKVVDSESTEGKALWDLVKRTLPNAKLVSLERIQNKWLWDRYCFAKERMHEKNKGLINERCLFHGTRQNPPEQIYRSEQGFDFRFSRQGMWGLGTYFAVNASYSHGYAYAKGTTKQLIVAKVLTGDSYCSEPKNDLRTPPSKACNASKGQSYAVYDSVNGTTHGSQIFIIYDHEKAYPAYLISYTCA